MSCKHRAGKIYAYSDLWDYIEAKATPSENREREREREAMESCTPRAIKATLQQLLGKSTQIIQSLDPLQHLFIHLIHYITYIFLW